ncbi:MAG: GspH/FimT family pseudopilin [Desulfosoma sp.]
MKTLRTDRGFTLVELMVTVAIVALLLKFVGWGLAGVTEYEDVRMAARRLETVIQEAKTLAYEKGAVYSLVFESKGYKLFRDDDGDDNKTEPDDGNCRRDNDNEPWIRSAELSSRVSMILESSLPKNSEGKVCLAFRSDGRLVKGSGGKVQFIGTSGSQATATINAMGWVHVD